MKSKILITQDPKFHQGKVRIYGFNLSSKIPTINNSTYLFLHYLMDKSETIIMSPSGGTVQRHYYKPISKLRKDSPTGGGSYMGDDGSPDCVKSTEEDTERFWLLNEPNFLAELSQNGWMIFPAAEEMEEYEKKKLGLTLDHMHHRKFSLKHMIKAMELTSHEPGEYYKSIQDLRELSPFVDTLNLVYNGAGCWGGSFFYTSSPKHAGEDIASFNLKLDGLETIIESSKRGANPMRRIVSFNGDFPQYGDSHSPRWWTSQTSHRISDLLRLHFEKEEIKSNLIRISVNANTFGIEIADRDYETIASAPNTGKLLGQATKAADFVKRAIDEEVLDHEREVIAVLDKRRRALGLI